MILEFSKHSIRSLQWIVHRHKISLHTYKYFGYDFARVKLAHLSVRAILRIELAVLPPPSLGLTCMVLARETPVSVMARSSSLRSADRLRLSLKEVVSRCRAATVFTGMAWPPISADRLTRTGCSVVTWRQDGETQLPGPDATAGRGGETEVTGTRHQTATGQRSSGYQVSFFFLFLFSQGFHNQDMRVTKKNTYYGKYAHHETWMYWSQVKLRHQLGQMVVI